MISSSLQSLEKLRVLLFELLSVVCFHSAFKKWVSVEETLTRIETDSTILSERAWTLLLAESSIGRVRSIDSDSMHTLSAQHRISSDLRRIKQRRRTDIVSLVKDNDRVLAHLLGDLFGNFRIEQIMERVDDDADGGEHPPHGEVGTDTVLYPVGFDVVEGPYAVWNQRVGIEFAKFLYESQLVTRGRSGRTDFVE